MSQPHLAVIDSGTSLVVASEATLSVKNGSILVVKEGATIEIHDGGRVEIDADSYFCREPGSSVVFGNSTSEIQVGSDVYRGDLVLTGSVSPGQYLSEGSVHMEGRVSIGTGVVRIRASGGIGLNPGFAVQAVSGSELVAKAGRTIGATDCSGI